MLNDKGPGCGLAYMASMSLNSRRFNDYYNFNHVLAVCEKFLCTASLLPEGELIGWQVDMKAFSSAVFTGYAPQVTVEDFNWIFSPCAESSPNASALMYDLYADGRKVYVLSSITGGQ